MALNRENYRKLDTDQLRRRYKQLDSDTSTQTMEQELGRMFAMQEIGAVLDERESNRQADADEWNTPEARSAL